MIPTDIFCAADYETAARRVLPEDVFAYIDGGSGDDLSASANRRAFSRWQICPRILRDVTQGHTRLSLAGQELAHPLLLAPVAYQSLVHPNGELDTARAAAAMQTCMISSTLSSHTLEDIAHEGGNHRWYQLYFQTRRSDTLALLRRAEQAGYLAIVVTLDASIQLPSRRALCAGFVMPDHCRPANLANQPPETQHAPKGSRIFRGLMQHAPRVEDLQWLMMQTTLPIWVKGVLHAEDAELLRALGVAGIVVSNHGGRTLDGVPASLAMLPTIRQRLGAEYPLLFDGGIRSGSDVFKALALGADAVLLGRMQLYALAVAGALGVAHMLRTLLEELEIAMATAGCANLSDVRNTTLHPNSTLIEDSSPC